LAIRTFLEIYYTGDAFGIGGFIGIGIIRWDSKNNAVPFSAYLPDPLDDSELDWMARWVLPIPPGLPAPGLIGVNIFDNTHLSKAKRKLENTSGLLWVMSTSLSVSATAAADHRFLLQQV
jgi:hypothetical protein